MYTNLWTTNVAYARPIFHATMAMDRFFQILRVSNFYNKLTSNHRRSTDKLSPITKVFESIVSRFEMEFAPNEHITFDEELAVFREKCPFHMLIKSKLGKCGIKIWVAVHAKRCYAYKTKYTHACPMEQGRRNRAFELSNIWYVTCMDPEEVILLLISVQVLKD